MKISKKELKRMIAEELNGSSVLLEMPQMNQLDPASNNYEKDRKSHTSELQSHSDLVCRLLLEKKKQIKTKNKK